ncbi:GGDEF domain-containing protein [Nocardia arthritidis]|uniref:Diguanylate cyclase n=1 Tax=Nocardia arthritidis TaxID=228602 RepID=A0A6G9YLE0_9NOCA|nr:GGDEF domain-containing protein [Nocardia arthritidis]QIS14018.1 diguanylate cyclase [Nocardia arthritidis]
MDYSNALLKKWWRDHTDYQWLLHSLETRSVLDWKRVLAVTGAVMGVIATLSALSPYGPQSQFGRVFLWSVIAVTALWTLRWWFLPWPSAAESLIWFGLADFLITTSCLQSVNRVYGAAGLILLVVTGGYLAFFHSAKILAAHACWSLLSVVVLSMRIITGGGDALAAVAIVLMMVAAVVAALPALQFLYWLLRTESVCDPLTGLLNRRGLEYQLSVFCDGRSTLSIISVDLDRFKVVNDTFGHQIGDAVLVRTALRLRSTAGKDAVVARTGGEEFVVVTRMTAVSARTEAERLRCAIAEPAEPVIRVTASIGVAVVDSAAPGYPPPNPAHLLRRADAAMYRAKRFGGNTVVVEELSMPC